MLEPGLVLVTGANGAGKTNLLESLHVGTQGFSPRTRHDAELVRKGADLAQVSLHGTRAGVLTDTTVTLGPGTPKRAVLNGAPMRSAEQLRHELTTLVFTPDRLTVVKGGPAVRRAYLDRALGRLFPARAQLPTEYATVLGQRNAGLRRVSVGLADRDTIEPWTHQLATLAGELVHARRDTIAALAPSFSARASELGLDDARLGYESEPPTAEQLEARLSRDLERCVTGLGPHRDEIAVLSSDRDLRTYGSQGEQRTAVLALLLAEAEVVTDRSGRPPLLLLDDVLSELDGTRRRSLGERIGRVGQTVVTATGADHLPLEPAQLLVVTPGEVRVAA